MNLDKIKEIYKKRNCVLLATEFVNKSTKMEFTCFCGNKASKTYSAFLKTPRCYKCKGEQLTSDLMKRKDYSYEEVDEFFESRDCVLLSTTYKGEKFPLEFLCFCGMTGEKSLRNFIKSPHCTDYKINNCF